MVATFTLVLALTLASTSANPAAGKPWHWKSPMPLVDADGVPHKSERIVGGSEVVPHSWPHQAAVFIDGNFYCGGSIISNEWILTAGHCLDQSSWVEVVLGAHNIQVNEPSQVTMISTDFFTHENFTITVIRNDLALIKLPRPITFNENITSVKLPSSDLAPDTVVTLTGWGWPSDSQWYRSEVLRQVDVPIMANEDCNAIYSIATDNNICVNTTGGKGPCNGDSGGPMNYNGYTYGVTSFGAAAGCEVGYPYAYSRITAFLDWIEFHTGVTPQ